MSMIPTTTELAAAARNRTDISPTEELCAAGVNPAIFDLGNCPLEVPITKGTLINRFGDIGRRQIDPNGAFTANKKTAPPLIPTRNSLSNYQSWTYKFSFYIAKIDALVGDPRKTKKIILAESGETNLFTLKNVEIQSVIAPGWKVKNFLINKFEFDLYEPRGGALFYEAIFEAANLLSIQNYINAPFYLELSWVGYDENGIPIVIDDNEVRSKIYALKIVDIKSSLSNEGSLYRISAIEFESWTSSNKWLMLDNHISIVADTVGKLFDKLQDALNKSEKQSGMWRMYPDEFVFNVDPAIKEIKLKESNAKEGPQRSNSIIIRNEKLTTVEIPRGYDINEILNDLMVASEEWVNESMVDRGNINIVGGERKTTNKNKRIWLVSSNIEIKEYDPTVNDYKKKITYNISSYFTTRANIDPGALNKTEEQIKTKDIELLNERSIGKVYEYIYTGQNTEVINLDIEFNFMWTTNLPLYAGLQQVRSNDEGPVVSSENLNQLTLASKYQVLNKKFQALNIFQSGERPGLAQKITSEIIETARHLDKIRDQREERQEINNRILEEISKNKEKLFASTVIEDLGKRTGAKPKPIGLPIPFTSDGGRPDTQARGIIEGSHRPFRSIAASVLNQIFYSPAELMQIDLEIRGDPSWLGLSGVEQRLNKTLFQPITNKDTLADRVGKEDILFVLEMKFSRFENAETGLLNFKDNQKETETIISGVYQCVEVTSRFNEGVFTQVLKSIRDTEITRLRNESLSTIKNKIK